MICLPFAQLPRRAIVALLAIVAVNSISVSVVASPTVSVQTSADPAQPNGFLITRTGAVDEPLDVEYETGGAAKSGVDYNRLPNRVTIPAGQSSARVSVDPIRRGIEPGQGVVTIKLLSPVRPFAFVALPDTQNYTAQLLGGTIAMLEAQVQWILDNRDALNIACVLHEGDCTNNNTAAEWQRFRGAMSKLEGQVPTVICLGNHDGATQATNNTALFNRYFPIGDFSGDPTFGGAPDATKMDNYCRLISAGGIDWLIFAFEFGPHNYVLDWANQMAARYPTRRIAMVTHTHVSTDNTLHGSSSSHTLLPVRDYKRDNDGTDVWAKFLKIQPGSALALSGHLGGSGGKARLVMNNDAGKPVYQMLSDFQSLTLGGNGLLRIMRFFPAEDRMSVTTYSPYAKSSLTDSGNQFEYTNIGMFKDTAPSYVVDETRGDASLVLRAEPTGSLGNLSVRALAGVGGQTLIVGFVTDGEKKLLFRGIGPTLAQFGVKDPLANPQLGLHAANGDVLANNDDWGGGAALRDAFNSDGPFSLDSGSRDAALLNLLPAGMYTTRLKGASDSSGIALVEAYDTNGRTSQARLLNVSARSQVGAGDTVLIAGFVVGGVSPKRVLIRGVGAGLRDAFPNLFSASEVLANPVLTVFDGKGRKVLENDNWSVSQAPIAGRARAFELTAGSLDAMIVATLPPGSYTAQISGVGNTTGIALVEVYDIEP